MIHAILEKLIAASPGGDRTFFDTASFPWVTQLEAEWRQIRAELDALLLYRDRIPNFQEISEDQKLLTEGNDWKTFFLYGYGHEVEKNVARCPRTAKLLRSIPGMKTAMFSILAPGKHIPPHRGLYNGVLRYHLGLLIPEPDRCAIRVGSETRRWEEGKSLIFDDTHEHEAWNNSQSHRVVLFVDFVRRLPVPLSLANRVQIWRISRKPFVMDAKRRLQEYED
jgi:aspartyl/asparaginyl beta-hydroxylase (cupin superfamily)